MSAPSPSFRPPLPARARAGLWLFGLVLAAILGVSTPTAAATEARPAIPWKDDVRITRTAVDDDLRNVLRAILEANDLSVVFRPEVGGTSSFAFRDVPLHAAFQQLIEEHGLAYTYRPDVRSVAVYPTGRKTGPGRRMVPLLSVEYRVLEQALATLGVGTHGITYDPETRVVSIEGDAQQAEEVAQLIEALEQQEQARRAAEEARQQKALLAQRSAMEKQVYENLVSAQVKVIPLRFANVAASTRTFQGQTVTVPGIGETLRAMLDPLAEGEIGPGAVAKGDGIDVGVFREVEKFTLPTIAVDSRTNSVIVRGTPEAIAAVEQVVRELDKPLQMIEIEVVIATAQIGVTEELGVSWRGSGTHFGQSSSGIDTGTSGRRVTRRDGNFDSDGLDAITLLPTAGSPGATLASFVIQGGGTFLQAQLNALAEQNRARVLSAPRLVALENETARLQRAQNLFVQIATDDAVGLEEVRTGLILGITPSIVPSRTGDDEPLVRLRVSAENSTPGAGTFGQIDVLSQEVQTEVLVPSGGTFIVGGLFDNTRREGQSGVPLLKDLPVVGRLFRTDTSLNNLGETLFLITPRIVEEQEAFSQDIASRVGSREYIREQRALVREMAKELERGSGHTFPDSARTIRNEVGGGLAALSATAAERPRAAFHELPGRYEPAAPEWRPVPTAVQDWRQPTGDPRGAAGWTRHLEEDE